MEFTVKECVHHQVYTVKEKNEQGNSVDRLGVYFITFPFFLHCIYLLCVYTTIVTMKPLYNGQVGNTDFMNIHCREIDRGCSLLETYYIAKTRSMTGCLSIAEKFHCVCVCACSPLWYAGATIVLVPSMRCLRTRS